jgi:UPF0716 family protein affecting phage T7 exclusion
MFALVSLPVAGMLAVAIDLGVTALIAVQWGTLTALAYLGFVQLASLPLSVLAAKLRIRRRRAITSPESLVDQYCYSVEGFANGQLLAPGALTTLIGAVMLLPPLQRAVAGYLARRLGEPPKVKVAKRERKGQRTRQQAP